MQKLQLTLAMIKPHAVQNPVARRFIRNTIKETFKIICTKNINMSEDEASHFYQEHLGKFFYHRLVTFMSSGSCDVHILGHSNAIELWRNILGPTKVFKTQFDNPNSLRGLFGLSDTRNVAHGSDSLKSAEREIQFFFPEFSFQEWRENEENHFRNGQVYFDDNLFVHKYNI